MDIKRYTEQRSAQERQGGSTRLVESPNGEWVKAADVETLSGLYLDHVLIANHLNEQVQTLTGQNRSLAERAQELEEHLDEVLNRPGEANSVEEIH